MTPLDVCVCEHSSILTHASSAHTHTPEGNLAQGAVGGAFVYRNVSSCDGGMDRVVILAVRLSVKINDRRLKVKCA